MGAVEFRLYIKTKTKEGKMSENETAEVKTKRVIIEEANGGLELHVEGFSSPVDVILFMSMATGAMQQQIQQQSRIIMPPTGAPPKFKMN